MVNKSEKEYFDVLKSVCKKTKLIPIEKILYMSRLRLSVVLISSLYDILNGVYTKDFLSSPSPPLLAHEGHPDHQGHPGYQIISGSSSCLADETRVDPGRTKVSVTFFIMILIFNSTSVHLVDGQLHHVCVIWSTRGVLQVYKDSKLVYETSGVRSGQQLRAGGMWVIGQDQDVVGGGFQKRDAFKGTLTGVNVWDRVLCPDEIERVAKDCGSLIQGNYKAYSDFEIVNATVLTTSSCCPTCS